VTEILHTSDGIRWKRSRRSDVVLAIYALQTDGLET